MHTICFRALVCTLYLLLMDFDADTCPVAFKNHKLGWCMKLLCISGVFVPSCFSFLLHPATGLIRVHLTQIDYAGISQYFAVSVLIMYYCTYIFDFLVLEKHDKRKQNT